MVLTGLPFWSRVFGPAIGFCPTGVSIRAGRQWNLPAILRELAAYFSLEITPLLQITWETFTPEQKPRIGKVLFLKNQSLSLILSSYHSIIKATHPAKLLAFPQNRGVWVIKQHRVCVNFHAFFQCIARSRRVHDKSTARKTQRTLLDLNHPQENQQRNETGRYMSFVFSLIILEHQFLKNYISVIYWFISCLKSIEIFIARQNLLRKITKTEYSCAGVSISFRTSGKILKF